jgi:hypothetical protein
MARKFRVDGYVWQRSDGSRIKGKHSKFVVTDSVENETEESRPHVAVFHVSVLWDEEIQELRANKLANFLNSVQDKSSVIDIMSGMTMTP